MTNIKTGDRIVKLDNGHWEVEDYFQRVTAKELKLLYLNKEEYIIFHGHIRRIGYKKVAPGVYEIFKKPYV